MWIRGRKGLIRVWWNVCLSRRGRLWVVLGGRWVIGLVPCRRRFISLIIWRLVLLR